MAWAESEWYAGRKPPRNRSLRVNQRTEAARAAGQRAAIALFGLALAGAVLALAWLALAFIGRQLYANNRMFTLRHLEIVGESDVPEGRFASYFIVHMKKINENETNLFSFDLPRLRDEFLAHRSASKYQSIALTRILPDTLRVQVVERVPAARLGGAGNLVADANGFVFGLSSGAEALPLLISGPDDAVRPGQRLTGNARAALVLLDVSERAGLSRDLLITSIDASGGFRGDPEDLRVHLADGSAVDIWWPHGQHYNEDSGRNLQARLEMLRAILQWSREHSRRVLTVNLTVESFTNNCAVTFAN